MENLGQPSDIETPESGARCTDVLSDTLRGYAGIRKAEFDLENGHLSIAYDPRVLSDEHALHLVGTEWRKAWAGDACAEREEAAARAQTQMGRLFKRYQQIASLPAEAQTRFSAGQMSIQLAGELGHRPSPGSRAGPG
jgi:hypothetical protein